MHIHIPRRFSETSVFEELAADDSGVTNRRLVDSERIVRQVERKDEPTTLILRVSCVLCRGRVGLSCV